MQWCSAALDVAELPAGIRYGTTSNGAMSPVKRSGARLSSHELLKQAVGLVVDDTHPAFIALEHLDFSELRNINKSDPTAIERLRDSDGLTVLHHLVFLLAHSEVDGRLDLVLSNENAAAKRELLEQEGVPDEAQPPLPMSEQQQTFVASAADSVLLDSSAAGATTVSGAAAASLSASATQSVSPPRGYAGGTRVSGPVKEAKMRHVTNLVRFFVAECNVDVEVRAPVVLDTQGNLLCMTAAEFALALSYTSNGGLGSSVRFVHALDSATVVGALAAATCQL
jgi:hypothetical protein